MNRNKKMRKKMMAGVAVGMAGIISAMPVCAATGDSVVTKKKRSMSMQRQMEHRRKLPYRTG